MHCRLPRLLLILLLLFPLTRIAAQDVSTTTWTNAAGAKIEAEFVRLTDDGVVLRLKSNGRESEIPLSSLSLNSHLQAIKLGKPDEFSKPLVKAEIPIEVLELEQLDPAVLLQSPFPADCSVEQFLQIVKTEIRNGNSMVVWHALPPGIQNDSEDVALKAIELGKPLIVQWKTLLESVNTIVQKKKSFVLGHPMVAAQPEVVGMLEKIWPALAAYTGAISDETLWDTANFRKGNMANWFAQFAAKTGPASNALGKQISELVPASMAGPGMAASPSGNPEDWDYNILSQSANSAEVEFTNKGVSMHKVLLLKVRGRWLPKEMLDQWPRWISEAKKNLAAVKPSDLTIPTMVAGGVVGAVGNLSRAASQQEFDQSIDQLKALIPAGAGMPGAGPPGAGQGPGGRPGLSSGS